jgi:nitroreductase
MTAPAPNRAALECILLRRSTARLVEPGPGPAELATILQAATTVPDHGSLRPYRFVVVGGAARARFGDALAAAAAAARPDLTPAARDKARHKAFAAPMLVAIIASPCEGMKIPEWEQTASAACTGYALALAAHALGLGAIWKSAAFLDGAPLRAALGMRPGERCLGWVNLGTREGADDEPRPAVDLASIVTVLPPAEDGGA